MTNTPPLPPSLNAKSDSEGSKYKEEFSTQKNDKHSNKFWVIVVGILILAGILIGGIIYIINSNKFGNYNYKDGYNYNSNDGVEIGDMNIDSNSNNYVGNKKSFIYDGYIFELKHQQDNEANSIEEYILQKENLEKYSQLVAIRINKETSDDAESYRDKIFDGLIQMGNGGIITDKIVGLLNEEIYLLYFAVLDPEGQFVEYNAFGYFDDFNENVKSYQFVQRNYGENEIKRGTVQHAKAMFAHLKNVIKIIEKDGCNNENISSSKQNNKQMFLEDESNSQEGMIYENLQYGFQLIFPESWKDYITKEGATYGLGRGVSFGFPQQEGLFSVEIYTKEEWREEQEEFKTGNIPNLSSVLGEDDQYVYTYPHVYEIIEGLERQAEDINKIQFKILN